MSLLSLFRRKSNNDLSTVALDEELRKVAVSPPPVEMYTYSIVTETETVTSHPMCRKQAEAWTQSAMIYGSAIIDSQTNKLLKWIPPHRIYEITFHKVGDADDSGAD